MNKIIVLLLVFAGFTVVAAAPASQKNAQPPAVAGERTAADAETQPVAAEKQWSCKPGSCRTACPLDYDCNIRCRKCHCNEPQPNPEDDWTFLQIGIFPGVPSSTIRSNVYGLKTGWPIVTGYGRVRGLEASWLWSGTNHIDGIQACWVYNQNREMNGIQASFVANINTCCFNGVQAAFVFCMGGEYFNGLQASAFNIAGDYKGFQAAAVANLNKETMGFQASVVYNQTENFTGFQTALINNAEEVTGIQLGLINLAKRKGLQFGLINIIEDGWLPFFPIVNFSF